MNANEKIKALRLERGWSQLKLAKMIGYKDRSSIARIENGETDLDQERIRQFAEVFDVSPLDLLGFQDRNELEAEIRLLFDDLTDEQKRATLAFLQAMTGRTVL